MPILADIGQEAGYTLHMLSFSFQADTEKQRNRRPFALTYKPKLWEEAGIPGWNSCAHIRDLHTERPQPDGGVEPQPPHHPAAIVLL